VTFLQFTRVINVFYVFNAILQCIPFVSTNSPMATIIPLTFIIIVGIIKEAVVEIKKWQDDKKINQTLYRKYVGPKSGIAPKKKNQTVPDSGRGML